MKKAHLQKRSVQRHLQVNLTETDSKKRLSRKDLGFFAEDLVANYLFEKGFKILAKNYQKKFGEIDLIAQQGDKVVFVEVKLRQKSYFSLSYLINFSKQRKIILTAKDFIMNNNFVDKVYRFDVALISNESGQYEIDYIENAFTDNCEYY